MVPWQTELVEEVLVLIYFFSLKIVPIMCTYGYTRKEITCSLSTGHWAVDIDCHNIAKLFLFAATCRQWRYQIFSAFLDIS